VQRGWLLPDLKFWSFLARVEEYHCNSRAQQHGQVPLSFTPRSADALGIQTAMVARYTTPWHFRLQPALFDCINSQRIRLISACFSIGPTK
jgi:hypothetical protein